MRKIALVLLVTGYILAGLNHFIHPKGYIEIIPAYLPAPAVLNYVAGAAEVILGVLAIFRITRKAAGILIILMLVAFIPVHIDMIIHAPMQLGSLKVTPLLVWVRLALQPVLMLWAWWATRE